MKIELSPWESYSNRKWNWERKIFRQLSEREMLNWYWKCLYEWCGAMSKLRRETFHLYVDEISNQDDFEFHQICSDWIQLDSGRVWDYWKSRIADNNEKISQLKKIFEAAKLSNVMRILTADSETETDVKVNWSFGEVGPFLITRQGALREWLGV